MATHSNGMSALQLQAKLDLGSYKTAWLLLHQLRRAMVNPDRTMLSGDVEVDETTIPFRTLDDPVGGGQGRSPIGKIAVIGAVELEEGNKPGRIRLEVIPDYRGDTLKGFIERNVERGSHILNAYLNEYLFRWNRRHSYRSAFKRLMEVGVAICPATYNDIRTMAA